MVPRDSDSNGTLDRLRQMERREGGCWSLDSLREYLVAIIEANDQRYSQRFTDLIRSMEITQREADRAIEKAEETNKSHFQTLNNYKEMAQERERAFIPRPEYELAHSSLERRLDGVTGALQKQVDDIESCMSGRRGEISGSKQGWSSAIAFVAVIIAVISVFIHAVLK